MNEAEKIRIADSAEAEKITALINFAFGEVETDLFEGARITLEEVRRLLTTGTFLLAESDDAIVGCVYLEPRGERAYLGLLSVDPSRQRSGLGSRLITAGETYCRETGARFMDIYIVNLRTELSAFYQRRGYVENGSTPFSDDVITKRPCHLVSMAKPL